PTAAVEKADDKTKGLAGNLNGKSQMANGRSMARSEFLASLPKANVQVQSPRSKVQSQTSQGLKSKVQSPKSDQAQAAGKASLSARADSAPNIGAIGTRLRRTSAGQ